MGEGVNAKQSNAFRPIESIVKNTQIFISHLYKMKDAGFTWYSGKYTPSEPPHHPDISPDIPSSVHPPS